MAFSFLEEGNCFFGIVKIYYFQIMKLKTKGNHYQSIKTPPSCSKVGGKRMGKVEVESRNVLHLASFDVHHAVVKGGEWRAEGGEADLSTVRGECFHTMDSLREFVILGLFRKYI